VVEQFLLHVVLMGALMKLFGRFLFELKVCFAASVYFLAVIGSANVAFPHRSFSFRNIK
jgi:hypothetical protein